MKVYLGTDHAGFDLKEKLKAYLSSLGHEVEDKGAYEYTEGDDYPDFIMPVAAAVATNAGSFGIVLGKSGQGEAMCANRASGVRAALYYGGDLELVRISREHNNANVLSLAAGFMTEDQAKEAVRIFLETSFSNAERHVRRLAKF